MIPDAAVRHFPTWQDNGCWGCTSCDWTGETIFDYWAEHETRRPDDEIPVAAAASNRATRDAK